jgi:hypothetical protein
MKVRLLTIARWSLLVWGGFSLLVGLAIVLFVAAPGFQSKTDSASPKDVRFVLNGCRLGDERIERVVHSYVSSRSFTGDHLDAYAIKISHVELAELTKPTQSFDARWYPGNQLPKVLDEAVDFVGGWLGREEISWFPSEKEIRGAEIMVYPWSIYFHGTRATAAQPIFIRPSDNMVFYFSGNT